MSDIKENDSILPPPSTKYETVAPDQSFKPKKSSEGIVLIISAIVLLISGSYNSIVAKLMNRQKLAPCDGCDARYFEAPFFQAWLMYLGEMLCILVHWGDIFYAKYKNKPRVLDIPTSAESFNKKHCPFYLWAIPAFLDFIGSVMVNYAVVFSQMSTIQLLRNFNVIVTAVISLIYIKLALRRHQVWGVIIVTVGLILTGIYSLMNPDTSTNYANVAWVGIVLAIVGTIVSAFQFIFEESLFRKYRASPFEAIGMMGIAGTIINSIALIVLEFIKVEKTSETFYMMGQHASGATILIAANVTYIISVALFNASGITITKVGSGLLRTIMISARTIVIWVVEIIIQWNTFEILNFIGLIVTFVGVMLYNYNYLSRKGACKYDASLRHPLMWCGFLRNPDAPPANEAMSTEEGNEDKKDVDNYVTEVSAPASRGEEP